MNLVIFAVDAQMSKVLGRKDRRIGVFGPYTKEGKQIIDNIAKTVCKNNYVAVTGYGAYLPTNCNNVVPSKEYLPPIVDEAVMRFEIPDFVKFHNFPRLMSRAIILLKSVRTQGNESEGCFHFNIPMLGIIIDSRVGSVKRGLCNYIEDYTVYQECLCPEKNLCLHSTLKPKCPFYDYVDVPWAIKQLFMTKINRLVALKEASAVDVLTTEYVISKMLKPSVSSEKAKLN